MMNDESDMNEEYSPPSELLDELGRHCNCCPICSNCPCDGVAAGGMCDNSECECEYGYE